jgi:CRP-like cAMP-binding protein
MSALPPDSLAARLLAAIPPPRAARHIIARGAHVFRQGDRASAVYVVESGRVRLIRTAADGARLVLQVAEAGDSFAEGALSSARYHCDAVAETDSVVLALPKPELLAVLEANPAECLVVVLALASQLRDLRARLELRNIRSSTERVLAWLRLNASGNPPRVALQRSWTLIADELGLTREAVYRALAALERDGRILRNAGTVCLCVRERA